MEANKTLAYYAEQSRVGDGHRAYLETGMTELERAIFGDEDRDALGWLYLFGSYSRACGRYWAYRFGCDERLAESRAGFDSFVGFVRSRPSEFAEVCKVDARKLVEEGRAVTAANCPKAIWFASLAR
ncbi:MAG TPA: hypothetical protein VNI01_16690 [Elusimicrobiota bacterium]|nr:hypothetical protein [Elusimicrobiota bacterium]